MTTLSIRSAAAPSREDAAKRAADAIREGSVVALPTETVYGLAALAGSAPALQTLRDLTGLADAPFAWHASSPDQPTAVLPARSGVHRRAFERLSMGPVTFMVDLTDDELTRVRAALGVGPGVVDDGTTLLVRIPGHDLTRRIIDLAEAPVVMAGAAPKGGSAPTDAKLAFDGGAQERIALLVDDGPTTLAKPSTLVRLALDGTLRIVREGAIDERLVRKRLTRTVLFVCSGNTCRSPMAAAIMNHLVRERAGEDATEAPIHAESAGTGAVRGAPQTPEGARALREMGVAVEGHSSRPLTPAMLADAERVFVMTPEHKRAAIELAPDLADRIETLDPDGGMIPDPIGMPQKVYSETADRLRALIERRLAEMDERQPSAPGAEGEQ